MSSAYEIGIAGIGCRFPGASSPEGFWQSLLAGNDEISEVSPDRWEPATFYSPDNSPGKSRSKWGGFIEGVDQFDAEFFGISPREATYLDPQQRLLLEVTYEALQDAGLAAEKLRGSQVGVFIGGFTLDYMLMQMGGTDYLGVESHTATGSMMTLLANRLSYVYDFIGPSVTVDTACSSSLVALHLACQAIAAHECDIAIVGGASALLTPSYTVAESQAGMLSPTGHSRAFDASADGYVRGEGAGVVVLRRLADVQIDGGRAYAAIRGTAVNQDGHSEGLTVPNGQAQEAVMRRALNMAGVAPAQVGFVEAHGTGTPVGDPIEANAIGRVFREGRDPESPCLLGSVKTNIGHLEAGAGVAGMIKAALSLYHGCVPAHLNLQAVNPKIDLSHLRLTIPTEATALNGAGQFAGVNSFGFGGTNAHAVLERVAPPALTPLGSGGSGPEVLLPLSAKSPAALTSLCERFAASCTAPDAPRAAALAAAAARRDHHLFRRGVHGTACADLDRELRVPFDSDRDAATQSALAQAPTAFVYSGMGPQWFGMGQELYGQEPVFRSAIDEVGESLDPFLTGWSMRSVFKGGLDPSRMEQTEVAQPANFALQVALTDLWRSWGVRPDYVMGCSAGELTAAYVAGIFSLPDAARLVYARSMTQQKTTGQGILMAVGLSLEELRDRLAAHDRLRIDVSGINSPNSITVVGSNPDITEFARALEEAEIFCRVLSVKVPYHSFYMEAIKDELLAEVAAVLPSAATTAIISTVTGRLEKGERFDPPYWYRNVREPVLFQDAVTEAVNSGVRKFLELGPHPTLTRSIRETADQLGASDTQMVSSLRRSTREQATMLSAAGLLYEWGTDLRWDALNPAAPVHDGVPSYPWQHQRFWHENADSAQRKLPRPHPMIWRKIRGAAQEWEADLDVPRLDYLRDHRIEDVIVFPGAGYTEMVLWCARELYGDLRRVGVEDLRFVQALYLRADEQRRLRIVIEKDAGRFRIASTGGTVGAESDWTIHATGRLTFSTAAGDPPPPLVGVAGERMEQHEIYQELARLGLKYGPEFKVVQWAQRDGCEVMAQVQLSPEQAAQASSYVIHPLLIDAAFQVLALARLGGDNEKTFMPVGIGHGLITGEIPTEMTVRASMRPGAAPGEIQGDVYCYDLSERPAFTIAGCRALDVGAESARSRAQDVFDVRWVDDGPADAGEDVDEPTRDAGPIETPRRWVVIGEGGFADDVANALSQQGCGVTRQVSGQSAEQLRDRLAALAPVQGVLDVSAVGIAARATSATSATPADADASVDLGLQIAHDFQACSRLTQTQRLQIWVVTCKAQPVLGELENSLQATAWGIARVAGQYEHPSSWGGLIDVDELSDGTAARVARQVLQGGHEDQVALYGERRYVARLHESSWPQQSLAPFKRDAAYLITGGFGALGIEVATWMALNGARHLVLLGRGQVPPRSAWCASTDRKVAAVQRLEALGATVEAVSADVTDEAGLREIVARRKQEGRPPIRGVVHAAGTAIPKLLINMTDEDFRSIARPKVHGAHALDRVFATGLDFFVLFSSIASLIVSAGQANYAAGNAYLDALAYERRTRGEPGLSVNWGPWGDVGMATQLDLLSFFQERGLSAMTSAQGTAALGLLMSAGVTQAAVLAPVWPAVAAGFPLSAAPPLLDDVCQAAQAAQPRVEEESFANRFARTPEEDRPALVALQVQSVVAQVLRYPTEEVPQQTGLTSLGLDSLMAIEVKGRLEKHLAVNVPIVTLLKGATLAELANVCCNQLLATPALDDELLDVLASADSLSTTDLMAGIT